MLQYVLIIVLFPLLSHFGNHSLRTTGQYLEDRVSEDHRGDAIRTIGSPTAYPIRLQLRTVE